MNFRELGVLGVAHSLIFECTGIVGSGPLEFDRKPNAVNFCTFDFVGVENSNLRLPMFSKMYVTVTMYVHGIKWSFYFVWDKYRNIKYIFCLFEVSTFSNSVALGYRLQTTNKKTFIFIRFIKILHRSEQVNYLIANDCVITTIKLIITSHHLVVFNPIIDCL